MVNIINKVYAETVTLQNPVKFTKVEDLVGLAVNVIIGIGWGLVFVMLAWGFVRLIMSRGEKIETQAAQQQLTYAVIGAIGLFMISLIRSVILGALGAKDPLTGL